MKLRNLGRTDLKVPPLVFGGNVFGWTVDKKLSFTLLDELLEAGFNTLDTADHYVNLVWCGVSESIIGEWMKDRGVRSKIMIITKCGLPMDKDNRELKANLHPDYMKWAIEGSLKRLQTDYIDVYMSHMADPTVPVAATLEMHQKFIDEGKCRVAAFSNYNPQQMKEALKAAGNGRARYEVLEPYYNLIERSHYEGEVEDICVEHGLGVIPYFSLESGFLTGKYRSKDDLRGGDRDYFVQRHLESSRGRKVLHALDLVSARHGANPAQVSLAWLLHRPSITAPIVSATNLTQLSQILKSADLKLTKEDLADLDV